MWLLHNISKYLVENYDLIITEDLNIKGMMKNHKLANSISNSSWGNLINLIDYKCKFYGKELIQIDRFFPSSKLCNQCGVIKENLTLKDRTFNCECGYSIDRDLNASLNIKAVRVTSAIQTAMGDKTCIKQAFSDDLLRFIDFQ